MQQVFLVFKQKVLRVTENFSMMSIFNLQQHWKPEQVLSLCNCQLSMNPEYKYKKNSTCSLLKRKVECWTLMNVPKTNITVIFKFFHTLTLDTTLSTKTSIFNQNTPNFKYLIFHNIIELESKFWTFNNVLHDFEQFERQLIAEKRYFSIFSIQNIF